MGSTTAVMSVAAAALKGEAITAYDTANAHLGVGNGNTGFSAAHTDLQGASKTRKAMDDTYPQRTGAALTFQATFGTSEANYAWEEWGVFNAASAGTMLQRKVESLFTKTNVMSAVLQVQVTLGAA